MADEQSELSLAASQTEEEETPWCECNRECFRSCFFRINIYWRTLGLSLMLSVYLLIGAAIFHALERPNEIEENKAIVESSAEYTRLLGDFVDTITNSTNLTRRQAINMIANITTAVIGSAATQSSDWEFASSLFFVVTVVTTIGYGNTAPVTSGGQQFFIIYALLGIPMTLVFLALLGEILKNLTKWFAHPLHGKWDKVWVKLVAIVGFLVGGVVLFITIPAIIFSAIEGWTYFQSVYYCFVTLTTVGFGDFVPAAPGTYNGVYRVCVSAWLFIGLAFISLVISLMQETFKKLTKKVENAKCKCLTQQFEKIREVVNKKDLQDFASDNKEEIID